MISELLTTVENWRLLVTVLGVIYVLSPWDFIPELTLGPIGLADDALVIFGIAFIWFGPVIEWAQANTVNTVLAIAGVLGVLFIFLGLVRRGIVRQRSRPAGMAVAPGVSINVNTPATLSSFVRIKWRL